MLTDMERGVHRCFHPSTVRHFCVNDILLYPRSNVIFRRINNERVCSRFIALSYFISYQLIILCKLILSTKAYHDRRRRTMAVGLLTNMERGVCPAISTLLQYAIFWMNDILLYPRSNVIFRRINHETVRAPHIPDSRGKGSVRPHHRISNQQWS